MQDNEIRLLFRFCIWKQRIELRSSRLHPAGRKLLHILTPIDSHNIHLIQGESSCSDCMVEDGDSVEECQCERFRWYMGRVEGVSKAAMWAAMAESKVTLDCDRGVESWPP